MFTLFSLPRTYERTQKELVPFIVSMNKAASVVVRRVQAVHVRPVLWQSGHIFTNMYGGHCCYSDVPVLRWNFRVRFESLLQTSPC